MAAMSQAVRVRIEGRVQGVGYRAWTAEIAEMLGLSGWVRNRRDGTVEALFAGPVDTVKTMLARCQEGPNAARVTAIVIEEEDGPIPADFEIRPTA